MTYSTGRADDAKLKSDIQYKFEDTEKGARIRISTNSPEALQAICDFLRFQI